MQSLQRGLRVLEAVAEHQPVGVGELSRTLGLPKSTVQRTLQALASEGWIRGGGGDVYTRWSLTSRALSVGQKGAAADRDLRAIAMKPMRELRDVTNETITLQVRDGFDRIVQIERVDSQQAVRTYSKIGSTWHLVHTSGGLAIMARLPHDEIERLLSAPIEQLTAYTVTDPALIREKIEIARRVGYGVNINQNRMGVCAVGAAIVDDEGHPIGAIGISLPDSRFEAQRAEWWGKHAKSTADHVSALLSG